MISLRMISRTRVRLLRGRVGSSGTGPMNGPPRLVLILRLPFLVAWRILIAFNLLELSFLE